jgi:hypothetical protein
MAYSFYIPVTAVVVLTEEPEELGVFAMSWKDDSAVLVLAVRRLAAPWLAGPWFSVRAAVVAAIIMSIDAVLYVGLVALAPLLLLRLPNPRLGAGAVGGPWSTLVAFMVALVAVAVQPAEKKVMKTTTKANSLLVQRMW